MKHFKFREMRGELARRRRKSDSGDREETRKVRGPGRQVTAESEAADGLSILKAEHYGRR